MAHDQFDPALLQYSPATRDKNGVTTKPGTWLIMTYETGQWSNVADVSPDLLTLLSQFDHIRFEGDKAIFRLSEDASEWSLSDTAHEMEMVTPASTSYEGEMVTPPSTAYEEEMVTPPSTAYEEEMVTPPSTSPATSSQNGTDGQRNGAIPPQPSWWEPWMGPWPTMTGAGFEGLPPVVDWDTITGLARQYGDPAEIPETSFGQPEIFTDPNTGQRWYRSSETDPWRIIPGSGQQDPGAQNMEELLTNQVSQALIDGDWTNALALREFQQAPSFQERLGLALQIASSPADYLTVVGMMRGEIPMSADPGAFGRIAPPAFERFFGGQPQLTTPRTKATQDFQPGAVLAPGAETPAIAETPPTEATEGFQAGPMTEAEKQAEIASRYGPRPSTGTSSSKAQDSFNPVTGFGDLDKQTAPPGKVIEGEGKTVSSEPVATGTGSSLDQDRGTAGPLAPFINVETPRSRSRGVRGFPSIINVDTPRSRSRGVRGFPSIIRDALGEDILSGGVVPHRKQLTELGALRYPSAQAWRRFSPLERSFFDQALGFQGISGPVKDIYDEQRSRAVTPARPRFNRVGFAPISTRR